MFDLTECSLYPIGAVHGLMLDKLGSSVIGSSHFLQLPQQPPKNGQK
jgi:hypothetical protein